MSLLDPCLIRSRGPSGQVLVRLGMPLVDDYLEFLEGRCRPNTVLAAGYDLRVFFGVVGKPPAEVRPADVLGFITAQRTGRTGRAEEQRLQPVDPTDEPGGVATSTVARRLSIVSGFFSYLLARGDFEADGPAAPRTPPTARKRALHPPARAGLRSGFTWRIGRSAAL
jgi:integrase/recombinase XerD